MIQNLSTTLLDILVEYNEISTSNLALMLSIDKKRLWYEVDQLNEGLKHYGLSPLRVNDGIIVNPSITPMNRDLVQDYLTDSNTVPTGKRQPAIVLFILTNQDWTAVSHLEDVLDLSRNTVLAELKKIKGNLSHKGLILNYNRQDGYTISGNEWNIRREIEQSIVELLSFSKGERLINNIHKIAGYRFSSNDVIDYVLRRCRVYNIEFVTERFYEVTHMLNTLSMLKGEHGLEYEEHTIEYFRSQPLYQLAKDICNEFGILNKNDDIFVTTRLMAAIQGSQHIVLDPDLMNLTREVINRVNVITLGGLDHVEQEMLFEKLYEHLVPSYYRIKYSIPLTTELTETIKKDYPDLFDLVTRALIPLAEATQTKIPESEIAYFTIHFGGHLRTQKQKERRFKAITVCSNGISSSILLDAQLRSMFPKIDFVGIHTLQEVESLELHKFDMIFSTIQFETSKTLFVTKPIMNWVEEEVLKKKVRERFGFQADKGSQAIEEIIRTVSKYVKIPDKEKLSRDLVRVLYYPKAEMEGTNLEDLLEEGFIQYTNESLTWEDAIEVASQPLLDHGYITHNYVNAMISKVKEIGPYIVLAPKVAIPHARPEDGAKELGISLLVSEKPIIFDFTNNEKAVQLIFVLSAPDNSRHLTSLQQLSYLLEDDENIEAMINEKDRATLYRFIRENSKEQNHD